MKAASPFLSKIFLVVFLFCFGTVQAQKKAVDPKNYGGVKEFKRLFEQELNYPRTSIDKDIGGRVVIRCEIDEKGKVISKEFKESVGRDVDAEAMRIANLLLFEPGSKNGEPMGGSVDLKFKFNPYRVEGIIQNRGFRKAEYPDNVSLVVFNEDELDSLPSINGRYEDFNEYVREKLVFPEEAKAKQINGYVRVQFVVEPNGRVSNVRIIEALEGNCDVVALDLIHRSKWKPGIQAGVAVRSMRTEKLGFFSLNPNKALFHSGEQTPNR